MDGASLQSVIVAAKALPAPVVPALADRPADGGSDSGIGRVATILTLKNDPIRERLSNYGIYV